MRLHKLAAAVFAVAMMATFADDAFAVRLGPIDAHPYMAVKYTYDDNVFVRNSNKTDDWFVTISPGILIEHVKADNLLQFEYRADIYRYQDTAVLNDVEDHSIRGAAYFNTDGKLWFKADDLARKAHEPRSEAFVAGGALNRYYDNKLSTELGYEIGPKLGVSLAYANYFIDYTSNTNNYRDRTENGVGMELRYKVLPKTKLVVEGVYKNVYHNDDSDVRAQTLNSNEYWTLVGLTWDITEKSTGEVKVGYAWKNFEFQNKSDFASPVYIVSLNHRFTPKTSIVIQGKRQANETDDPNTNYYTTTGGSVMLNFNPVKKLTVSPYASYYHNRYAGATVSGGDRARRLENLYGYGLQVNYDMNKWISVGLAYDHSKKSSTLTSFDYTRNMVSLLLTGSI